MNRHNLSLAKKNMPKNQENKNQDKKDQDKFVLMMCFFKNTFK